MADNTTLNAGAGGDVIASDDIVGVKYQRVKVNFGADGSATDVSSASPLPTDPSDRAARDMGKIDVASLDQYTPVAGRLPVDGSGVTQPVSDGGGSLTVDGTVSTTRGGAVGSPLFTEEVDGTGNVITKFYEVDSGAGVELVAGVSLRKTVNGGSAEYGTTSDPINIADAGGSLTVDGSVSLAAAIPAGNNNIGDVDVASLPAIPAGNNNIGDVDVASIAAGDNNIGNVDIVSGPTDANAIEVQGTQAHDAVDAQNPIGIGYRAIAHGTNPTAVAAADRTVGYANRAGVPFVIGGHPNVLTLEAAYTAAQTDVAVITVGAGAKIVITQAMAVCDNANSVNVGVRLGFGTANTPTTTGVVLTHPGIAPGSGVARGDGSGMLGIGADNEDLRVTCTVPTGGSIRVLVSYYTIES